MNAIESPAEHAMETAQLLIEECDWCLNGDRECSSPWNADFLKAKIKTIRTGLVEMRDELFAIACGETP